ncbi:MAG: acyl-CoA thioesterase, partial [Moraxellaceae bacterium]|nr:acyl-CoA thioesterase [Moraxellaceae bacterium]
MTLVPLFDSLRHSDTLTMPAGWTQGRANYGGLVGALLYARMEKLLGAPRVLRSATVSFVGP